MADNIITSLAAGLETAITQAVQNAVGGNQSPQQSQAQQAVNKNIVTSPAPVNTGGATPTDASSVEDPMAKTGNMQTGEFTNPYQQEQQQLTQQLGSAKLYETPQATKDIMKGIFATQTEKYNYAAENDPLVKAARENLEQQVTNMVAKRGFKYGNADDIINSQMTQMIPQFEQIARGEHADFLTRQLNLANTIMQWEKMQFDRSKDQVQLLSQKLDAFNKMEDRDFKVFKMMLEQRNINRTIWLQQQKFALAKKIQESQMALERIEQLGYVDEEASIALGVPVGVKAKWVQQLALEKQNKLELMAKENEYNLQKQAVDAQLERELYELKGRIDLESQLKLQAMTYQYKKDLQDIELSRDIELKRMAEEAAAAKARKSSGSGSSSKKSTTKSNSYLDAEVKTVDKSIKNYMQENLPTAVNSAIAGAFGGGAVPFVPEGNVLSHLEDLYNQGVSPEVVYAMKQLYGL
jgi:hypothetical protein